MLTKELRMTDKLNWCEIGPKKTHRYDVLSQFLSSQGIQNQFTFIESDSSSLKDKIQEAREQNLFIKFHPSIFGQVVGYIENNLREIEALKSLDGMRFDSVQGYWPELLLRDSLFEYLAQRIKNLDVSQTAFIVGSDGLARAAIAGLIKLGFSRINITSDNDDSARSLIEDFNKIFFNVAFEFTKKSDVTILPGTHGTVVNTFSILDSESVPSEIYYFNFLKKGGWVVDLIDVPMNSPFTRIAEDIGANVIKGYEVLSHYDIKWSESVTGQKLSLESYQKLLETSLDQVEYDKAKIQKILEEFQM